MTEGSGSKIAVPAGAELIRFAEALVARDFVALQGARDELAQQVGAAAVVDAAAIVGNFERMVRIADGTGIPLDAPVAMVSADLREELGIDQFGSASETPPTGTLSRFAGRLLRPLIPWIARRQAGGKR